MTMPSSPRSGMCPRLGVSMRLGRKRIIAWHDRVAPLREQGLSCALIAERLGVSRNSVERVVRRKRTEMLA